MSLLDTFSPVEIVNKCINCYKGLNVSVVEGEDDDVYENQDGKPIIIEDWIYLYPIKVDVPHETLSGTTTTKETRWTVSYGYVIHGVRYYPDGSGEPDDYDEKEVAADLTLTKAIHTAAEMMYSHSIDAVLENLDIEAMTIEDEHIKKLVSKTPEVRDQ